MGLIEPPQLLRRHLLTMDQFYRMAESGVLAADARVELIEGEIVDKAPMRSRHACVRARLSAMLSEAVGQRALLWCRLPLRLCDLSEPEPDLMLVAPREDFYAQAHPAAEQVLLLVEVSDTTAPYDRKVKLPLYARHGIREVWIVDLDNGVLRTFRGPQGDGYTEVMETAYPGRLSPMALPDVSIDAFKLLV